MNSNVIVIHTHFHNRRTGVTRSIENVFPFLQSITPTFLYGYGIDGNKITTQQLKEYIFSSSKVVVHCHRNNEILKMLWYRLLGAKFKLVSTRHAETTPSWLTKVLLKKSDAVITLTETMHQNLEIENIKVTHGVNTNVFIPKKNSNLQNIQQENIILCAGRVRKAKGQTILVNAVVNVLKENKKWALVIVGKVDKPEFLNELKSIVTTKQLENQVYFIDETSDIVSYYQAAKITVVPSFSEGFSLVCAEAMACGNTVIATQNVGVHSELINDKKTGYLFEAGNSNQLEEILQGLVKEKSPCLGDPARNEIVKNWSAKKEAEELFSAYLKLLGE